jgi:hypothetical protein
MEWISAKDKLPEENVDVLVWVASDWNRYDIGRRMKHTPPSANGWDTNCDLSKYRPISHWMSLPKRPTF